MEVETTRFGTVAVDPLRRVFFPEGLLGFGAYREFVFVPPGPEPGPLIWLQSCQAPELAFAVCRSDTLVRDYAASVLAHRVHAADLAGVEAESIDDVTVYLIVHRDATGLVANLRGPLIVNPARGLARQLVLNDERVPLRHRIALRPAPVASVRQAV